MDRLTLGVNIGISVYSELLLLFLFIAAAQHTIELTDQPRRRKLLLTFLGLTAVEIAADLLSRLDGVPGTLHTVCSVSDFVLFLLNPVLVLCWYLYVAEQMDASGPEVRRGLLWQLIPCGVNALCVIVTPFTGLLYSFDSGCVYRRGPLFWVTTAAMACMISATEIMLFRRRRSVERRHLLALLLFPAIPLLATLLQIAAYGVAFALNATVYSILIVCFYMQNRSMDVDYLTGLYNRRKLDIEMQRRIDAADDGKPFAAILLDIDRFKKINDTHGHNTGDSALRSAALVLRGCLRADTLIARYGGDEFCVLLDLDSRQALEQVTARIRRAAEEFNRRSDESYVLTFGMGGDLYEPGCHMKLADFQEHIDRLMYEDKRAHPPEETVSPSVPEGAPRRRASDQAE